MLYCSITISAKSLWQSVQVLCTFTLLQGTEALEPGLLLMLVGTGSLGTMEINSIGTQHLMTTFHFCVI